LWRYNGNWTWISGNSTINLNGNYGTKGEKSNDNIPGSRQSSSNWIDNEGNFWLFGGVGLPANGSTGNSENSNVMIYY
jgi:hypothetical protein